MMSTNDMWAGVIQKSKDGGLEFHEPVRGQNLEARTVIFGCLAALPFLPETESYIGIGVDMGWFSLNGNILIWPSLGF
ncbi:hypothetical protein Hanom_Chr02g00157961 [Helianthus anomalus]